MEKIKKSLKCFSEEEPCVTNKLESFVHVVFLGTFFFSFIIVCYYCFCSRHYMLWNPASQG